MLSPSVMLPDLVAYLPCPIKVPFELAVAEFLERSASNSIKVLIEGNANKNDSEYQALANAAGAADLPTLLITPGANQLFSRQFIDRVLDSGAYRDCAPYPYESACGPAGIRDPLGHATVLAANVTVMVVDRLHLGRRAVPRGWHALMQPEFAQSVIMRGNGQHYCETTLLTWQKLFGNDGLVRIGRSIREGWHPAQMAKVAGTGNAVGAAVYVMPYFFARTIRNQDQVEVVWPEEGVIASPVTMLAKRDLPDDVGRLAAFLAGPAIAALFSRAGLPTPHPDVACDMPKGTRYVWSGWDSARSGDLSTELAAAEEAFASGQR